MTNKIQYFFYIFFILFFIYFEMSLAQDGSKGIIGSHLINNKLQKEHLLFGFFFQNLYNVLLESLNFLGFNNFFDRLDLFVLNLIFLFSPFLWLILLSFKNIKTDFSYFIIFALLFLNPFFLHFIHYAYQQSLAFVTFLLIWQLSFKKVILIIASTIPIVFHLGIVPTLIIMNIYEIIKSVKAKIFITFLFLASCFIIYMNFPISRTFLPRSFPYFDRLTRSNVDGFDHNLIAYYNDFGEFMYVYFIVGLIPILIITIIIAFKKYYINEESRSYNLILASSFPIVLFNFVPSANRLSYFFIIVCLIYGPNIFLKTLNMFKYSKINYYITFVSLILLHIFVTIYFSGKINFIFK